MARVLLDNAETFNVTNDNLTVIGNSGTETLIMFDGAPFFVNGISLNQTIEQIQWSAASSSYQFQQSGNVLKVYLPSGELLASMPVGSGNSLNFTFNDTSLAVNFALTGSNAGKITVGGQAVSTLAGGATLGVTTPIVQPSHQPTAQEQYMLELLNRARLDPTGEANLFAIDLNEGLAAGTLSNTARQPLAFNNNLTAAARDHSQDMLAQDFFAHTNLAGQSPFQRMTEAGYTFSTAGENIAYAGTTATLAQTTINNFVGNVHEDLFVDEGIVGRGHRLNMLEGDFKEVGIGIEVGVFTTNGNNYNSVMVTQNFGTQPNAQAFLLGVIYQDDDNNNAYSVGEGMGEVTITVVNTTTAATQTLYSMTAGGYQVALAAGTYDISYSAIGESHFVDNLVIGVNNVKVDWIL
ncbi:MAG: hypothetical protein BWK73_24525 [Thiothrix lacustris]|uniref:SCP domain-containing protein n=1 Tax=Thiothrix lacustris TaxID=525917 RepID=A0A1Y1QLS7_9GAMM|nr:MAG: hypothetical protein BWK73_24525 [Thiothrix lacustris]